jgi:hypothetical protein
VPRRRATVEEALRRAVEIGQRDRDRRADGQRAYLERLTARADIEVLNSGEMWQSPHVSRVRKRGPVLACYADAALKNRFRCSGLQPQCRGRSDRR